MSPNPMIFASVMARFSKILSLSLVGLLTVAEPPLAGAGDFAGKWSINWTDHPGNPVDLTAPDAPTTAPKLSLARQGAGLRIEWTPAGGTLQAAPTAVGPWTDESGVANGATIAAPAGNRFFRVRL